MSEYCERGSEEESKHPHRRPDVGHHKRHVSRGGTGSELHAVLSLSHPHPHLTGPPSGVHTQLG